MKRWHDEVNVARRNRQKVKDCTNKTCSRDNLGRFRKKDGVDCGNSRCKICHSDKFPKRELTKREKESLLNLKIWQKEENTVV